MAIIGGPAEAYTELVRLLKTVTINNLSPDQLRAYDRYFLRTPSVYDWHEPCRHPKGFFIARPDVYAWFDPIKGADLPAEPKLTGWRRSLAFGWNPSEEGRPR